MKAKTLKQMKAKTKKTSISKFQNLYNTLNETIETEERFKIINNGIIVQKAELWWSYMNRAAKNYGNPDSIKVMPFDEQITYAEYLAMFESYVYILAEIEIRATGYNVLRFAHKAIDGQIFQQTFKFEGNKIIKESELDEKLKAIGGATSWTMNLNPKQEVEVIIRGKRLKWL